jgi:hypothetical protein
MFDAKGCKKQESFIISHWRPSFQTLFASFYLVLNAKPYVPSKGQYFTINLKTYLMTTTRQIRTNLGDWLLLLGDTA